MVQNLPYSLNDEESTPIERQMEQERRPRDPDFFLSRLAPSTLAALSDEQRADVRTVIAEALPKTQPKIIDLRFVINLLFDRYYVVLFMGKDLRRKTRNQSALWTRLSNLAVAIFLLLSMNVFISLTLAMLMYLVKSAVGIDLFPGHLSDRVESL